MFRKATLQKIPPGSPKPSNLAKAKYVKVVAKARGMVEKFWVRVTGHTGRSLLGTVDNNLVGTAAHGYKLGDRVKVQPSQVFATMSTNPSRGTGTKRNPLYHLHVTAPTEAKARARGQRFGRVVSVVRLVEGKWDVLVDQRKKAPNPARSAAARGKQPKRNPARLRALTRL